MNKTLVSHVGIAVSDLQKAVKNYRLICGNREPQICEVPDQKVTVAIFAGGGHGGRVELVAPSSPDSPVAGFISKRGEGLHHVCLYVDDIERSLADLKAAGVRLIDEIPRVGAEGHRIAFVHPGGMNGVLVELEERPR